MLRFILNNQTIETDLPAGSTVLDFLRNHKRLTGTKTGCREGDCGACTVLVGEVINGELHYQSMTSCLMPLGNAKGKHIVSVEGINFPQATKNLSPVQEAMVQTNGTQCGFCTIGFVMSFTGFVLDPQKKDMQSALESIDGNICRCTGYKSIERAADMIVQQTAEKPAAQTIPWLVDHGFIPTYFNTIQDRLKALKHSELIETPVTGKQHLSGGTDLLVQKPAFIKKASNQLLYDDNGLQGIQIKDGICSMGASVTVTEFMDHKEMANYFTDLPAVKKLVSSTPIRNMATMAGNIVNASPIGDMSVFLLALNSKLVLKHVDKCREVMLKDFFKGYKQLDKTAEEIITQISFSLPEGAEFSFEKVCKRTHLDIASVNSACQIRWHEDGSILDIHISAGGVAPFPRYLTQTRNYLLGKQVNESTLSEAIAIMNNEIAPISDVRGSDAYKRLLLRQLFLAHFMKSKKQTIAIDSILTKA